MEFRILGPLEVWADGRSLPLGGVKQRSLLAILVLHAGEVVPADRLIAEVWSESPPGAGDNPLWVNITRLRNTLEPGRGKGEPSRLLRRRGGGYALELEAAGHRLDLAQFHELVARGRRALAAGAPEDAAALLRQALGLWRGPALADLAGEPFARAHVPRLEELRLAALQERMDADLARGRDRDLIGELEALVASHPVRERLRGQLMLALYRAGRQADALEVYRQGRQALAEELGIDPDPALQRLERAILGHDPALAWRPPAPPTAPGPGEPAGEGPADAPSHGTRRTVTISCFGIAVEPANAASAGAGIDPELLARLESRYLDELRAPLLAHGGTIERLSGESLTAVFGLPVAHENDALRAIRAASEVLAAVEQVNATLAGPALRLSASAGIDTGEVVVARRRGELALTGAAPRIALAHQRAAGAGEILLGAATRRLVRNHARLERVADVPDPAQPAWRLLTVHPDALGRRGRRMDAPLVGRKRELRLLGQVFERVVADRACQLVTVLGSAGIGKSRLVEEFLADTAAGVKVLRGRCLDYGQGITYWSIAEAIRQALGPLPAAPAEVRAAVAAALAGGRDSDVAAEQLAALLGAGEISAPQELPWAVRKLLEALAQREPVVLVIDDLHWAEPALLDLVEHLADLLRDGSVLLCCMARPELLEARPGWAGGKLNAVSILLEPLVETECSALIANILGELDLEEVAVRRLCEVAEGNPLFLEELIAMLVEDGILAQAGGRWVATADLGSVQVPPTVSALLAARLDRLGPGELAVLQSASVVGKQFGHDEVAELCPPEVREAIDAHLLSLTRKQLLRPDGPGRPGADDFSFRHLLIRDAAYQAVPKRRRAELHRRFAAWLDARRESDEIIAHHLEQSYLNLGELGVSDDTLRYHAAERLARAGQRASDQWNHPAANGLLARARTLLSPGDPLGLELVPALVASLGYQGDLHAAGELAAQGAELARVRGEHRLEMRIRVEQQLTLWTDGGAWSNDQARHELRRAIPLFEQEGDTRGLGAAWLLAGRLNLQALRYTAMRGAYERAAQYLRRVGDQGRLGRAITVIAIGYTHGPTPVPEAVEGCERLTRQAGENRGLAATIRGCIAWLEAMRGDFTRAWMLLDDTAAVLKDIGHTVGWIPRSMYRENVASVAGLQGDYARAEESYRASRDELELAGASGVLSTETALLASVVYAQGRVAEAGELTRRSEALASSDDLITQLMCRSVRSKVLALTGRGEEALRLSDAAIGLAVQTDSLNFQADAWMDRAEVLRLAGRTAEAAQAAERALERYARKGNEMHRLRARSLLAELIA
jgi:DNA-binding SARP family transcriptional activator/class 3 adenylate cyclase